MRTRLSVVAVLAVGMLAAQGPDPQGFAGEDPPSRVARLNWLEGPVSFQPASVDAWSAATLNYPLTTGDHIYTDNGARAEMRIGRNSIRLNEQTNFGFLNLDDQTVQIRFTGGSMETRLRTLEDQEIFEVDTPNGAISLLRTGDYRIDTDPSRNATMVTVFSGDAEITADGQTFAVHPRQTAWFADGAPPDIRSANPPDDFDRFTADRNRREDTLPPTRHVNPAMIGGEDLDAYGTWREMPDYGWVWAPPVEVGWAPYRTGRWAWVEPWGWTWIDEAPWGFAPFHYGRWANAGGRWVWIPGAVAIRPVYAPALVAFVGGPRFSIGVSVGGGIGAVAWFPLGPREVYRPVYASSPAYVRNINITHVTNVNVTNVNITNVRYVNQNVQGAATAVPQNVFVGGRPVRGAAVPVTSQQMANGQISHAAMVAPQRESVLAGARTGPGVTEPPQAMLRRQVVARATPPPPPISFQAKQATLSQNPGRPLGPDQLMQLRERQPAAPVNRAPVRSAVVPGQQQPQQGQPPQIRPGFGGAGRPAVAAPANQPPFQQPVNQPPVNRLDGRPPTAVPPQGQPNRPEFNRPPQSQQPPQQPEYRRPPQSQQPPQQPNQQPEYRRQQQTQPPPQQPEYRRQQQSRQPPPQPEFNRRPAPESRPEPAGRQPNAAPERSAPQGRPPADSRPSKDQEKKDSGR